MKAKKAIGWVFIVTGGIYVGLLGASGIEWLIDKTFPVNVNIPLLVGSIVLALIGFNFAGIGKNGTKSKK